MADVSKGSRAAIVRWGLKVFERHLVSGWGGNISSRFGKDRYLITRQHAALGFLSTKDIVEIDAKGRALNRTQHPSSETAMHLAIYAATDAQAIVHVHPPGVIGYCQERASFVPLSFEEKYTLGEVPVVPQDTPTVTEPARVVAELRLHPVVILQGHGTVAYGKSLQDAFLMTDLLEEAVHCQIWSQSKTTTRKQAPAKPLRKKQAATLPLFSRDHVSAMMDKVNEDATFRKEGREKHLTTSLTMSVEDESLEWTFHFDQGKIVKLDDQRPGEFVIRGKKEWWAAVFQKSFDPFLATQQGKLQLVHGEIWQLSQWFKPFQRGFELWQAIPTK